MTGQCFSEENTVGSQEYCPHLPVRKRKRKKINKTEKAGAQCASMPSWWRENQTYLSGLISSRTQMCLASHRSSTDMGLTIHTFANSRCLFTSIFQARYHSWIERLWQRILKKEQTSRINACI